MRQYEMTLVAISEKRVKISAPVFLPAGWEMYAGQSGKPLSGMCEPLQGVRQV